VIDVLLGARWALAAVLIGAAVAKLRAPGRDQLEDAIRNYRLVPSGLVRPVAAGLPWLELTLGLLLCVGVMLVATAVCAVFILAAFGLAVGWHVLRGRRFACGCGNGTTISWALAGRDLMLSVVALAIAVGPSGGLAVWPGWAAQHVSASVQALLPIPLVAITLMLGVQLLTRGKKLARRRGGSESGRLAV
jgi:methylamine utilization protein MauE